MMEKETYVLLQNELEVEVKQDKDVKGFNVEVDAGGGRGPANSSPPSYNKKRKMIGAGIIIALIMGGLGIFYLLSKENFLHQQHDDLSLSSPPSQSIISMSSSKDTVDPVECRSTRKDQYGDKIIDTCPSYPNGIAGCRVNVPLPCYVESCVTGYIFDSTKTKCNLCAPGYTNGGSTVIPVCVDFQTDPLNCGTGRNVCPVPGGGGTAFCVSGICEAACPTTYLLSGGNCYNVNGDSSNCGGVGNVCFPPFMGNGTASCSSGTCQINCTTPGESLAIGTYYNVCYAGYSCDSTSTPVDALCAVGDGIFTFLNEDTAGTDAMVDLGIVLNKKKKRALNILNRQTGFTAYGERQPAYGATPADLAGLLDITLPGSITTANIQAQLGLASSSSLLYVLCDEAKGPNNLPIALPGTGCIFDDTHQVWYTSLSIQDIINGLTTVRDFSYPTSLPADGLTFNIPTLFTTRSQGYMSKVRTRRPNMNAQGFLKTFMIVKKVLTTDPKSIIWEYPVFSGSVYDPQISLAGSTGIWRIVLEAVYPLQPVPGVKTKPDYSPTANRLYFRGIVVHPQRAAVITDVGNPNAHIYPATSLPHHTSTTTTTSTTATTANTKTATGTKTASPTASSMPASSAAKAAVQGAGATIQVANFVAQAVYHVGLALEAGGATLSVESMVLQSVLSSIVTSQGFPQIVAQAGSVAISSSLAQTAIGTAPEIAASVGATDGITSILTLLPNSPTTLVADTATVAEVLVKNGAVDSAIDMSPPITSAIAEFATSVESSPIGSSFSVQMLDLADITASMCEELGASSLVSIGSSSGAFTSGIIASQAVGTTADLVTSSVVIGAEVGAEVVIGDSVGSLVTDAGAELAADGCGTALVTSVTAGLGAALSVAIGGGTASTSVNQGSTAGGTPPSNNGNNGGNNGGTTSTTTTTTTTSGNGNPSSTTGTVINTTTSSSGSKSQTISSSTTTSSTSTTSSITTTSNVVKTTTSSAPSCATSLSSFSINAKAPVGMVTDSTGALFVVDRSGNQIFKVVNGVSSVYCGSGAVGSADGPCATASFNAANGIDIDSSNNLYLADTNNHKIRVITPQGTVHTLAGSVSGCVDASGASAAFNLPYSVAWQSTGYLFVADFNNNKIRLVNIATGAVSSIAGGTCAQGYSAGFVNGLGSASKLKGPHGVSVLSPSSILIADAQNNAVRMISNVFGGIGATVVTTFAGTGVAGSLDSTLALSTFNNPLDVAVSPSGNWIYISDQNNAKIRVISTGSSSVSTLVQSTCFASFGNPDYMAITSTGTLYFSALTQSVVLKLTGSPL